MEYNVFEYWAARERPNNPKSFEESRLRFDRDFLRSLPGVGPIFELGPGIGRTFEGYGAGRVVYTLDVTRRYEAELRDVAARTGVTLKQSYITDLKAPFPFEDDAFECGVALQVFLHQPPDLFAHAFSEMSRICRTVAFNAGIHNNSPAAIPARSVHVFAHDYLVAAEHNGLAFSRLETRDLHLYAVTKRKNAIALT